MSVRSVRQSHRGAAALVLYVVLVGAVLAASVPASADPAPQPPPRPKSPPTSDQVFVRLVAADAAVTDASVRLQEAERSAAVAGRTAQRDAAAATAAADAFDAADRTVHRLEARWRSLTARAYVGGGSADAAQLDELLRGRITDGAGRGVVMLGQVVDRALGRIVLARAIRATRRAQLLRAAASAPGSQRLARDRAKRLTTARWHLTRAVVHQARVRAQLWRSARRPQPENSLATPLLGLPRLTPEDLASWFTASNRHARTTVPVEFLAAWYIDEGRREGVRGDIAFAQAVLETGGFTNIDSVWVNNYAGIGHCDSCPRGFVFKTPQLGVRAQIQLLKSYALKTPAYVNPLVDRRLHGPAGCCPTWGDLTRRWATAPTYGPRIMAIYTDIVAFALRRVAASLPHP